MVRKGKGRPRLTSSSETLRTYTHNQRHQAKRSVDGRTQETARHWWSGATSAGGCPRRHSPNMHRYPDSHSRSSAQWSGSPNLFHHPSSPFAARRGGRRSTLSHFIVARRGGGGELSAGSET